MGRYVTEAFLLQEGITIAHGAGGAEIIARAEDFVDQHTHQFFNTRIATYKLDGNGETFLELPVPLILITSISLDDMEVSLDDIVNYGDVYEPGISVQDERMHPRLEWESNVAWQTTPRYVAGGIWSEGRQNIVIAGTWGCVDKNTTVAGTPPVTTITYPAPRDIQLVVAKLIRHVFNPTTQSEVDRLRRQAMRSVSESGGGHSISQGSNAFSVGPTGIVEIDGPLARWMR
jgi:hypothetical protein